MQKYFCQQNVIVSMTTNKVRVLLLFGNHTYVLTVIELINSTLLPLIIYRT